MFKKSALVRVPVRLGLSAFTDHKIPEVGIKHLEEAMLAFKHLMKANDVVHYKGCATSAMREAANGPQIVKRIKDKTGINIEIISLHRPNDFFQNFDQKIGDVEHTYQTKYFKDISYFSDSTGMWRFGHPFNSAEFATQKTLHILIHPIWWTIDGASNTEKIKNHFIKKQHLIKDHYLANCKPFKEVYDQI